MNPVDGSAPLRSRFILPTGPGPEAATEEAADIAFGPFLLQPSKRRLLEHNRVVPLGSRALDVLAVLAAAPGRTVSKHELLQRAWGGRIVGENNLTVTISALRRALHDTAARPIVQTVPGQGYRFVAPCERVRPAPDGVAEVPSIAVLPFRSPEGEAGHDPLGEGMADALIAALARNRWLAVTAHDSSAGLRAGLPAAEAARHLGVRYVLQGEIGRAGAGIRVVAQLTDAVDGSVLALPTCEPEQADIFAARDEIAALIIAAVRPALIQAEQQRSILLPPASLDAWSACLRGAWHLARFGKPELAEARSWFQRATALDPKFAPGFHGLALAYLVEGSGWMPQADPHWQPRGEALALQAVVLDDRDSGAHAVLGFARMVRGDLRGSLHALEIAAALNPNDAMALAMLGATMVFLGQCREGLQALDAAFRLSPNDPRLRVRRAHAVLAHYFSRDYGPAEAAARAMIAAWPDFSTGHRLLCYVLAETGRPAEARDALAWAQSLDPSPFNRFSHERMPWYRAEDFDRVVAALRLAGWAGSTD